MEPLSGRGAPTTAAKGEEPTAETAASLGVREAMASSRAETDSAPPAAVSFPPTELSVVVAVVVVVPLTPASASDADPSPAWLFADAP